MTRLSETPLVHPSAEVSGSTLGRYTKSPNDAVSMKRNSATIPT